MTEISLVPLDVSNNELEGLVCKVLSLTGNEVFSNDLEACHLQLHLCCLRELSEYLRNDGSAVNNVWLIQLQGYDYIKG